MIDAILYKGLQPLLETCAKPLVRLGVGANSVTTLGFIIGLGVLPALYWQHYEVALLCILLNRLSDGLDGAIARLTERTEAGGYLDSVFDFIFYSAVPFGFLLANPSVNGVTAGLLMFSFMGTAATFLAFAVLAGKHGIENPRYPNKSLHYMGGITEGFETIVAFVVFCLWPSAFVVTGKVFAALCLITVATRLYLGFQTLRQLPEAAETAPEAKS
ncbi:Inner membrane protein YnjF [Pseudidiomarina piscicola]|uniref:Inner membrane protein YnjF n=1 Tax=Pseudidiomarina piscicola TaxID=2614830 RepID=A0A6S6WLK9_9GAMM|nr:CDP-alcohol phosphatidyltransferase family protein [Pseudidiomarina piscicola]CAB0150056.1 Inner membrane protein YnjF [Pseudidiomarina piscicola]VZT39499.1 Inner membrane protein YnjF [Pseudomonas aeruginosa]